MIRWWAAYIAFLYATGAALNIILDRFGLLSGWWLLLPDSGLGVLVAFLVPAPSRKGVSYEHDRG